MKPQILRGLRFLFRLVVSEAFLCPVSCCAVVAPVLGYRTLRVAVVPLAFWRSVGIPGAVSRHPPVFRAPCGFSYWAWPLFVPVGGSLPARLAWSGFVDRVF